MPYKDSDSRSERDAERYEQRRTERQRQLAKEQAHVDKLAEQSRKAFHTGKPGPSNLQYLKWFPCSVPGCLNEWPELSWCAPLKVCKQHAPKFTLATYRAIQSGEYK